MTTRLSQSKKFVAAAILIADMRRQGHLIRKIVARLKQLRWPYASESRVNKCFERFEGVIDSYERRNEENWILTVWVTAQVESNGNVGSIRKRFLIDEIKPAGQEYVPAIVDPKPEPKPPEWNPDTGDVVAEDGRFSVLRKNRNGSFRAFLIPVKAWGEELKPAESDCTLEAVKKCSYICKMSEWGQTFEIPPEPEPWTPQTGDVIRYKTDSGRRWVIRKDRKPDRFSVFSLPEVSIFAPFPLEMLRETFERVCSIDEYSYSAELPSNLPTKLGDKAPPVTWPALKCVIPPEPPEFTCAVCEQFARLAPEEVKNDPQRPQHPTTKYIFNVERGFWMHCPECTPARGWSPEDEKRLTEMVHARMGAGR